MWVVDFAYKFDNQVRLLCHDKYDINDNSIIEPFEITKITPLHPQTSKETIDIGGKKYEVSEDLKKALSTLKEVK